MSPSKLVSADSTYEKKTHRNRQENFGNKTNTQMNLLIFCWKTSSDLDATTFGRNLFAIVLLPVFMATLRLAHQTFAKSFTPCLHQIKRCFLHRPPSKWRPGMTQMAQIQCSIVISNRHYLSWTISMMYFSWWTMPSKYYLIIHKQLMPLMPATAMLSPIVSVFGGTFGPTAWMIPKSRLTTKNSLLAKT